MRRVVITGMGAISPFGVGVDKLWQALINAESGVQSMPEYRTIGGLRCHVAAPAREVEAGMIPRKYRRTMSMMSVFAVLACQEAIQQANLPHESLAGGRLGVAVGSTTGSTDTTQTFFHDFFTDYALHRMKTGVFFKIMNHSCAANIAQTLGITGRILSPSAACSTGNQAIGYGYEMIALGKQDFMFCGGSDELHPLTVGTFDIMNAASIKYNDRPNHTPRPFDRDRDGVVCSEGSGILLLESLESAVKRKTDILAEIVGFATTSDVSNIANPEAEAMKTCMGIALTDAGIMPEDVDYINAHATATEQGDIAESRAIQRLFGDRVPVSSLKGNMGHTMAASGALETLAAVRMIDEGVVLPTLNLECVDERCAGIRHVIEKESFQIDTVVKNNFALGGVNSSLVLRRYANE